MSAPLHSGAASDAGPSTSPLREKPIENEQAPKQEPKQEQQQLQDYVYSEETVTQAEMPTTPEGISRMKQAAAEIVKNVFTATQKGQLDDILSEFLVERAQEQMNLEKEFNETIRQGKSDAFFRAIADGDRVGESFLRSLNPRDVNANNELYQYLTEQTNALVRPNSSVLADNALKELDAWYNYDKELAREVGHVMDVLNGDAMSRLLASIEVPQDTMIVQVTPNLYTRLVELLQGITANMTVPMRRFMGFISEAYKLTSHYVPVLTSEVVKLLNPKMAALSEEERTKVLKDAEHLAENQAVSEAAMSIVSPLGILDTYFLPETIGHVETLNEVELRFVKASLKADMVLRRAIELLGNIDTASLHQGDDPNLANTPDSTNPLGQRSMQDLMMDAMQNVERKEKNTVRLKANYTSPTDTAAQKQQDDKPIKSGVKFSKLQEKRMAAKIDKLPVQMRTMASSFAEAARQSLDGDAKEDKDAADQAEGHLPFINKLTKIIMNKIVDNEPGSIGSRCIDAIQEQIEETNSKSTLAALIGDAAEFHRDLVKDVMETVQYHDDPNGLYKKENSEGTLDVLDMLVSSVLNKDDNVISERMSDAEKRQVRAHVAHHLKIRKKARRIVIIRSTAAEVALGNDPLRHDENDADDIMAWVDDMLNTEESELTPRGTNSSPNRLRPDQPLRHVKKRRYDDAIASADDDSKDIDDSDDMSMMSDPYNTDLDFSFIDQDGDDDDVTMFDAPSIQQVTSSPTPGSNRGGRVAYTSPFKRARITRNSEEEKNNEDQMDTDDSGNSGAARPQFFSQGRVNNSKQTKRTRSTNDLDDEEESDDGKMVRRNRRGANARGMGRGSVATARVSKKQIGTKDERAITRRSARGGVHGAVARQRATRRANDLKIDDAVRTANVPTAAGNASAQVAAAIKKTKSKVSKVAKGEEPIDPEEAQRAFEKLPWSEQYLEQLKGMKMSTFDAFAILSMLTTLGAGVGVLLYYSATDKNNESTAADALSISLMNSLEKRTALTNDHFAFSDSLLSGTNSVRSLASDAMKSFKDVAAKVQVNAGGFLTAYDRRQQHVAQTVIQGQEAVQTILRVTERIADDVRKDWARYQGMATMINLLARAVPDRLTSPQERTQRSIAGSVNDPSVTEDQRNIARTTPFVPSVQEATKADVDSLIDSVKTYHANASPNTPNWMMRATQNVLQVGNQPLIRDNPSMTLLAIQEAALDGLQASTEFAPVLGMLSDNAALIQEKLSARANDAAELVAGDKLQSLNQQQRITSAAQMEHYMRFIGNAALELRNSMNLTPQMLSDYQETNRKAMDELSRQINETIRGIESQAEGLTRDFEALRKGLDRTNRYVGLQMNLVDMSIRENALAMDKYFHTVWLNYNKSVFEQEPIQRDYKAMDVEKLKQDGTTAAAVLAAGGKGMTWSSMNFLRQGMSTITDSIRNALDLNKAYEDFSRVKSRIILYTNNDFAPDMGGSNNDSIINEMIEKGWIYKRNPSDAPPKPADFALESICAYGRMGGLEALKNHGETMRQQGKELTITEAEVYYHKYLITMSALEGTCAEMYQKQSEDLAKEAIAEGKDARTIENAKRLAEGAKAMAAKFRDHYNTLRAASSLGVTVVDGATSLMRFLNTTRYGAAAIKNFAQIGMLTLFVGNIAIKSVADKLRSTKSAEATSKDNQRAETVLKRRKRANATAVIVEGKTTRISMSDTVVTIIETGLYGINHFLMTICKFFYDASRTVEEVLKHLPDIATISAEVREAARQGGEAWAAYKDAKTKDGNFFNRQARGFSLEFYRGMSLGIDAIGSIVGTCSASMIYHIDRIWETHSPGLKEFGYWNKFWNKILRKDYALKLAIPAFLVYQYGDVISSAVGYAIPVISIIINAGGGATLGSILDRLPSAINAYFEGKFLGVFGSVTGTILKAIKDFLVKINMILNKIDETMPGFKFFVAMPALFGIAGLMIGCMPMFSSLAMYAARQSLNLALSAGLRAVGDWLINQLMKRITGNSKFKGTEADMKTLAPYKQVLYVLLKLVSSYGTRYAMMNLNYYTNLKFLSGLKFLHTEQNGLLGTGDVGITAVPDVEMLDRMEVDTDGTPSTYSSNPTSDTFKPLVSEKDVAEILTNPDSATFDIAKTNELMSEAEKNFKAYDVWVEQKMSLFSDLLRFVSGTSIGFDNKS